MEIVRKTFLLHSSLSHPVISAFSPDLYLGYMLTFFILSPQYL